MASSTRRPSPNDFGPANIGQLKHVATMAREEFDARLPGGSGAAIDALVGGWYDPQTGQPLVPNPPDQNLAPINLGQLKAVAKPFYDRLIDLGLLPAGAYPWTATATDDANYAPANLGQLKNVFNIDVVALVAAATLDPDADFDGDGITNGEELAGPNPTDPLLWDSDGDGVGDGDEKTANTDPNDAQSLPSLEPPFIRYSAVGLDYEDTLAGFDENEDPIWGGNLILWDDSDVWFELLSHTLGAAELNGMMPENAASPNAPHLRERPLGSAYVESESVRTEPHIEHEWFLAFAYARREWLVVDIARDFEIRRSFLKVTEKSDDGAPPEVVGVEAVELVIPARSYHSDPIDYAAEIVEPPGEWTKVTVFLLPVELYSDLNNDGQLTSADAGLVGKPYESGASEEEKDKGTEFMFANDQLSNGAWDTEDTTTPGVPGTADDDDAEEIVIKPGITEGEVWLDHPAIAGMKFYKTRKCTEEIQLSSSSHFTISSSNPFPDKVFMRADSVTFPTANPQVEGDLKLMIKPNGGAAAGIEATKMKLTIIKEIGAKKYFNGARDYMLEQNARLHVRYFKTGSHQIRITAMRHESTDMGVIETYHRNPKIYGMPDVVAKNQDHYDLILNGNFCFFDGGTAGRIWGIANQKMTPRCHGGCIVSGAQNPATSVGSAHSLEQAHAEYLGVNGKGTFAITTGIVPLSPPVHQAALGGFADNLVGGNYNMHPWFGLAEIGPTGGKRKLIFTVTQTAATTQYPVADLVARLTASGKTLCVAGDGGSSTAIAHRIEGDSTQVKFAGGKHYPGHYWINTYVGFKSDKPRP